MPSTLFCTRLTRAKDLSSLGDVKSIFSDFSHFPHSLLSFMRELEKRRLLRNLILTFQYLSGSYRNRIIENGKDEEKGKMKRRKDEEELFIRECSDTASG